VKKIFIPLLGLLFLCGCSKDQEISVQQEKTGLCPKEEKQQAQKSFARILSRAASQRQDVRSFFENTGTRVI